jgi:hypothetical protein
MTTVIELTRFLQWALADGPLPSAAIKRAMEAKGLDSRSQKQMTAARRRAGVICPRHGMQPGQWQEWRLAADSSPPMAKPDTWAECENCHRTAWLASSTLLKACLHCPRGTYRPTLQLSAPASPPLLHPMATSTRRINTTPPTTHQRVEPEIHRRCQRRNRTFQLLARSAAYWRQRNCTDALLDGLQGWRNRVSSSVSGPIIARLTWFNVIQAQKLREASTTLIGDLGTVVPQDVALRPSSTRSRARDPCPKVDIMSNLP